MRTYCNCMQNDWIKWLLITEFTNNNIIFININMNFLFVNKDFNSHMFFHLNNIEYITVRERLESVKIENINEIMQRVLKYMQQQFYKACKVMIRQVNKRKKKISYERKDKVFLFNRNIITDCLFKKLENKMMNSIFIIQRVEIFYRLRFPKFLKIYDVFHSHLLWKELNEFLSEQI